MNNDTEKLYGQANSNPNRCILYPLSSIASSGQYHRVSRDKWFRQICALRVFNPNLELKTDTNGEFYLGM